MKIARAGKALSEIGVKESRYSLNWYKNREMERRELGDINYLKKERRRLRLIKLENIRNKNKSRDIEFESRKLLRLFYPNETQYVQFLIRLKKAYSGLLITSILAKSIIQELIKRELIELVRIIRYRGEIYNLKFYSLTQKGLDIVFPIKYPPIFFNYLQNWNRAEFIIKKILEDT